MEGSRNFGIKLLPTRAFVVLPLSWCLRDLLLSVAIPRQIYEETGGEDAEDEEAELPVPRVRVVRVADPQVPLSRDRQTGVRRAWNLKRRK